MTTKRKANTLGIGVYRDGMTGVNGDVTRVTGTIKDLKVLRDACNWAIDKAEVTREDKWAQVKMTGFLGMPLEISVKGIMQPAPPPEAPKCGECGRIK